MFIHHFWPNLLSAFHKEKDSSKQLKMKIFNIYTETLKFYWFLRNFLSAVYWKVLDKLKKLSFCKEIMLRFSTKIRNIPYQSFWLLTKHILFNLRRFPRVKTAIFFSTNTKHLKRHCKKFRFWALLLDTAYTMALKSIYLSTLLFWMQLVLEHAIWMICSTLILKFGKIWETWSVSLSPKIWTWTFHIYLSLCRHWSLKEWSWLIKEHQKRWITWTEKNTLTLSAVIYSIRL